MGSPLRLLPDRRGTARLWREVSTSSSGRAALSRFRGSSELAPRRLAGSGRLDGGLRDSCGSASSPPAGAARRRWALDPQVLDDLDWLGYRGLARTPPWRPGRPACFAEFRRCARWDEAPWSWITQDRSRRDRQGFDLSLGRGATSAPDECVTYHLEPVAIILSLSGWPPDTVLGLSGSKAPRGTLGTSRRSSPA